MKSLICLLLLALLGCATPAHKPFQFSDMEQIKVGMTKGEVKALIGQSYTREIPNPENPWARQVWWWKDPQRGLAGLVFNGDRVAEKLPLPEVGN